MRKLFGFLFVCFFIQNIYSQADSTLKKRTFTFAQGSLRNHYPYPVTDIQFRSAPKKFDLRFYARLRSYGIRSLFNGLDYDLTLSADKIKTVSNHLSIYAGIGTDIRIRLVHDSRSAASSSAEPLIKLGSLFTRKKFSFDFPLWTRFYSNGFSLALMPQPQYQISKKWSLFVRYELMYVKLYRYDVFQWRHESVLGANYSF